MGIMQLVQSNSKVLLEHWEPSSAKISLHFLIQPTWKTGEGREGKDSCYAPLLAQSSWMQPLPSHTSCPSCLHYLKAWMRAQAAWLLWDNKAQKSPSTKPCKCRNKQHQFSP